MAKENTIKLFEQKEIRTPWEEEKENFKSCRDLMKLYETLETQLKNEPNFVTDDGALKKWVVLHRAQNFDVELIALLLENKILKEKFFVDVKGTLVFNQNRFVQFLEQKNYLNDSYSRYKNKVGLTIDGKYLKQRNEVALVWPFKDCILEGGQSREEQKREEIFFNEILAQDEITQLLEPKVLTAGKVFDKDGEHSLFPSTGGVDATGRRGGFTRDAELNQKRGLPEDTIIDNLIIKGNNLLALHSLKKEFAGKVKLIYIDPPYNTGNDGFRYNDHFNHSSWLTFMKNRLEVARQLLRDDGVMFVQCDDNEQAYLKVLIDEVFGRENFVGTLIRKTRSGGGAMSKYVATNHDYTIMVTKKIGSLPDLFVSYGDEYLKRYKESDDRGRYFWDTFIRRRSGNKNIYEIQAPNGKILKDQWNLKERKFLELLQYGDIKFVETKESWSVLFKQRMNSAGKKLASIIENAKNDTGTKQIIELFGGRDFVYPKPEEFIQVLLDFVTAKDDIVLDYHLGSGTTAAVAHKMKRQYIGIEQMDYIEDVAVERLKKVVNGEQGGISKSMNWKGGGTFTYLELKKYNQSFIEQIEAATDTDALLAIWKQMKVRSFLHYNIDIKKQEAHLEDFKALSLKEQKQHLCELLDKNQLYVNLSSLHDKDFACTDAEKALTQDFYQKQ